MANAQIIQAVNSIFEISCVELFRLLGCDVARVPVSPYELGDVPVATIDAGNSDIEVMLILRMPLSILGLTYPGPEDIHRVDESKLEAWIPELANQLMGKLKNKLIAHDCSLNMGLPNCYFGPDIDDLLPSGFEHFMFYFDVDGEIFECCLSIDIHNDAMPFKAGVADEGGGGEGELELF